MSFGGHGRDVQFYIIELIGHSRVFKTSGLRFLFPKTGHSHYRFRVNGRWLKVAWRHDSCVNFACPLGSGCG